MLVICFWMWMLWAHHAHTSNVSFLEEHQYVLHSIKLCLQPEVAAEKNALDIFKHLYFCVYYKWDVCLQTQTFMKLENFLVNTFPCGNVHLKMQSEEYFHYTILVKESFQVKATFVMFHLPKSRLGCNFQQLQVVSIVKVVTTRKMYFLVLS